MATVLFEGVFSEILLKRLKMTILRYFSNLRLSLPHILWTIGFFNFPPISYLLNLD